MKELRGQGKLVVTDNSELAPALYIADKYYIVPRIIEPEYIQVLLDICKNEKIDGILSLIDPELSLLAEHREQFENIGVKPIVSPFEACELWLDKYETQLFCLENGFKTAKTYIDFDSFENAVNTGEMKFPVFLKPQKGSASLHINKAKNVEEAKIIFKSTPNMILQEYLDGQEIGVDVYVDLITKELVSIFAKEKIAMRAGETDKSKSYKSDRLMQIVCDLVREAGLVGPIDIDVFYANDDFYISEINPRFGGGYLHAYECGVNFIEFIIQNLKGQSNSPNIGEYEEDVYMMKHDSIFIKKETNERKKIE